MPDIGERSGELMDDRIALRGASDDAQPWPFLRVFARLARKARPRVKTTARARVAVEDVFTLLDAAPVALLLADATGHVIVANAMAERLFGHAPGHLVDLHMDALVSPSPRGAFAPDDAGLSPRRDRQAVHVDGSEVPVDVDARPVRLGGRDMQLVVLVDIAERRQREREAAEQREELAHLARVAMLGELSGAVAHEINQPLSAILTNAQAAQRFLRNDPPDLAEIDAILADIVADDRRAGEVILRLRKWLRKEHVEHESVSLNGVVLDTLHLVRGDLLHRGVDVHLELAGELPRVSGDRVQLQQVLLNLVMNGCDAMDGMPMRVLRLRTCRIHEGVRVEVIDRGRGISPAISRTMFDPFQTTKASGMGMGLAVCRSIVEAHGGRIVADDLPEGGARLAFELPVVHA